MFKKLTIALSFVALSFSALANEATEKDDFRNKMKALLGTKDSVLLINTPEEYTYNLVTTDFIKGLMNQYAGFTRIIASTENESELDSINKEMFLNVVCAQAALGQGGQEHYEVITELALVGLDKERFEKNSNYLISKSEGNKNLLELPLTLKECKKEGLKAIDFANASKYYQEEKQKQKSH